MTKFRSSLMYRRNALRRLNVVYNLKQTFMFFLLLHTIRSISSKMHNKTNILKQKNYKTVAVKASLRPFKAKLLRFFKDCKDLKAKK